MIENMKNKILIIVTLGLIVLVSCQNKKSKNDYIDENRLGIIDADVNSEDTNLDKKAEYGVAQPGEGARIDRSFENAPPLIPHTVNGFLPIKMENNICLTCHLPDKVEVSGAVPISKTHFSNWRPQPTLVDGVYHLPPSDSLINEKVDKLNNQYFNCTQCHVPQTEIRVDIENLFTPEFRQEFGIEKSNLKDHVKEGIE